ncbi:hypothetical protein B0H17DRAFT_1129164 [Mycena rosella]|uniref:C2H2-type domain-containing protein n=1 Tax=Mycena rosella TaxID=1033263 RepID=A0AAD7DVW8_MYCRO|nr:hypothetical protein B0H17DRAFT_1129164 [Mycena rosella]
MTGECRPKTNEGGEIQPCRGGAGVWPSLTELSRRRRVVFPDGRLWLKNTAVTQFSVEQMLIPFWQRSRVVLTRDRRTWHSMSLTLPIQALATMQVTFKVELNDGKFTFDMIRENGSGIPGLQSESGKTLELCAVRASGGVTLTIRVSREVEGNSNNEVELGGIYEDTNPQQILLSEPREHMLEASVFPRTADLEVDTDMEFLLRCPHIPDTALRLFDVPDALSGFDMSESPFSAFTTHTSYDHRDYFNPGMLSAGSRKSLIYASDFVLITASEERANSWCTVPSDFLSRTPLPHLDVFGPMHDTLPEAPPDVSSGISDSSTTDDTSSSAPSTPSEIHASPRGPSRSSRPHSIYHCPEPECQRNFKSRYTLSKHVQAHRRKTRSPFPCTMGCAREFSRKHDRLRHEVTQHGRVCATCGACQGFFSSEATLSRHKCRMRGRP